MEELGLAPQPGLRGKAALIIGGGFGIGRSVARMLASQGVRLALVDMDAERLKAASGELSAFSLCADVQAPGAARAAVAEAAAELGGFDILVNIVGKGMSGPAAGLSAEVQRAVLEVNYLHHVEFCSAFAQAAIADGRPAVITMVSALAGLVPFPGQAAYGAAKAALNSYTASLAVELAPQRIRVNAVAPGIVHTDRNTRDSDADRKLLQAIPLGPFADQPETASVIVLLSSDDASCLTGQTLIIDRGPSRYVRFWPGLFRGR